MSSDNERPTDGCTIFCVLHYWLWDGGRPCPHGVKHIDPKPWNCTDCQALARRPTSGSPIPEHVKTHINAVTGAKNAG